MVASPDDTHEDEILKAMGPARTISAGALHAKTKWPAKVCRDRLNALVRRGTWTNANGMYRRPLEDDAPAASGEVA